MHDLCKKCNKKNLSLSWFTRSLTFLKVKFMQSIKFTLRTHWDEINRTIMNIRNHECHTIKELLPSSFVAWYKDAIKSMEKEKNHVTTLFGNFMTFSIKLCVPRCTEERERVIINKLWNKNRKNNFWYCFYVLFSHNLCRTMMMTTMGERGGEKEIERRSSLIIET